MNQLSSEEIISQLKKQLEEQEMRYQEKTRELEHALKLAEQASGSKTRFLAQTSHEIRTPLNIIIGMTDLALDELDKKDKVKDYLMKIESSSKILLGIINDILDMSAIEGGKMKLESQKYDFKEQITQLSIMQYQQAKKKNIHFDVQLQGVTEDSLIGDELRVNQILINLMSNAFKFTKANGTVTLQVIQASTSRDRVHMRFIVKDSGCGMSEDLLSRLFRPFEQENASTARKYGGSGLGLSITKNLVDMMGGSIRVNSQLGAGTEFIVDIPFGKAEKGERSKISNSFAKYRAIVVASNEEHCMERGAVLEDMGIAYDISMDGEEALDMMGEAEEQGHPYSVCVIDWTVASMPGLELIKQIREIFGNDMIIIGAAFEFSDSLENGMEAGANYMVAKPVFRSTLFDAIMMLTNGEIEEYNHPQKTNYDFSGRRILLAEDVALNMEVAVKLLKRVGVEVVCAENGQEAVTIFRKKRPGYFDCIFLDINMPVMDGYEAARQIRGSDRKDAGTVPIYAMTANAFTSDVSEALDCGMNGHIAKPIETDVLYKVLDELFNK